MGGESTEPRLGPVSAARRLIQSALAVADLAAPRLSGPRILIYHQVGSGRAHEMNVPVGVFGRQLDLLTRVGEIVSLTEAVERRGDPDADRLFVLTFDDGYSDVYRNAYPIMHDRRIPFTVYVTSGPTEDPDAFPDWPGEPMTWDELRTMQESGLMTLGAHTHTHLDLRHVDRSRAADEVERSNEMIESRIGEIPRHFTYPKGWWSETADAPVRRAYDTATVGIGPAVTADADLHTLGRVSVMQSDPSWAFRRKLVTGGRAEGWARRRRHGYEGP